MLTSDQKGMRRTTFVTAVSREGFKLEVAGQAQSVDWASIGSVIAGVIQAPSGALFILAIEFEIGQMVIVTESEPVWADLTVMIQQGLPGIDSFSVWGAKLATEPDVLTLYERPNF